MGNPISKSKDDEALQMMHSELLQTNEQSIPAVPIRQSDDIIPGQFDDADENFGISGMPLLANNRSSCVSQNVTQPEIITSCESCEQESHNVIKIPNPFAGSIIIVTPPFCYLPESLCTSFPTSSRSRQIGVSGTRVSPIPSNGAQSSNSSFEESSQTSIEDGSEVDTVQTLNDSVSERTSNLRINSNRSKSQPPLTLRSSDKMETCDSMENYPNILISHMSLTSPGLFHPSPLLEHLERDHPHPILVLSPDDISDNKLPILPLVERDEKNIISYDSLSNYDVLFGRGAGTYHYPGNVWFRKLMERYRNSYCTAKKGDKGSLASNLRNYVRLCGGRFLEPVEKTVSSQMINLSDAKGSLRSTLWCECGDFRAQMKVGQTLREGTASFVRETLKRTLDDTAIYEPKKGKSQKRSTDMITKNVT